MKERKTFAWKLGDRSAETLKEFLDEIGVGGRDFITDDYEAYHKLISEVQWLLGKDLTFPLEQDNRHTKH